MDPLTQFQEKRSFTPRPENDLRVFAGVDITAFAIYGKDIIALGNAHTISYSIHREKFPVRRLGRSHAAGYTRGARTIAGSLVFINFKRSALDALTKHFNHSGLDEGASVLSDQLPAFDLLLLFRNESGDVSHMRLIGVEIADEGGVLGVNEEYTETTMQYLARDITTLTALTSINFLEDEHQRERFIAVAQDILSKKQQNILFSSHDNPTDVLTTEEVDGNL